MLEPRSQPVAPMKIQQLVSFCAIVQHGMSISKAAESMHTSQPGVSRQIRELEASLGVELVVRKRNRLVTLTNHGKVLIEIARGIVSEAERMRSLSKDLAHGDTGSLVVATTHAHARYSLPAVVKAFGLRFPGVSLTLLQGNPLQCATHVQEGAADLGIAAEIDSPSSDLAVIPAYKVRRSLIATPGHVLLRKRSITLADIARFPLIAYDRAFGIERIVSRAFDRQNMAPRIVLRAIDADVIKTYVELGLGIAVVSSVVYDKRRDLRLRSRDVTTLFDHGYVCIYARRGAHLRRFALEFISAYAPHLNSLAVRRTAASGTHASGDGIPFR